MALFGKKRKPMFPNPGQGTDITPQQPFPDMPGRGFPMMQPQEQPRPGLGTRLLGEGWEDKAFALGSILQGDTRTAAMMRQQQQQALQAQQEAAMRRAEDLRKRSLDREDWLFEQQWQRDNPKPVNNDTVNDFVWYKSLSPEERQIYHDMNPVFRQGEDGRFYRVDVARDLRPVGKLKPYVPKGGAAQNSSGGF